MSKRASISVADLPPEVRAKLNVRPPRKPRSMTKDDVRGFAIKMLATVDHLTQAERKRVIQHALKVNAL